MEKEERKILIDGQEHNFNIYLERRNSVRASITQSGVHIRVPRRLGRFQREKEIEKLSQWAIKKLRKNPALVRKKKTYAHGDLVRTHNKEYFLDIALRDSIKNFSKIDRDKILFKISEKHDEKVRQEYISKQLQKMLAREHLAELERHVHHLNDLHFKKDISKVSYKTTHSRWGYCRPKEKEIVLSTKLLLAPMPIFEYVIIHELAHLIEANHSKKFWDIVRDIDPTYKEKVKWLKANGHTLEI